MWESKDNALDATYNADHIWFDGIGGQHTRKPADIRKWEDSKVHKLIEKHFPKVKADKMLADLPSIALEWAKQYVRQRQTFKVNTKGENMAPLAFQSDPDGTYQELAIQLRNYEADTANRLTRPKAPPSEPGLPSHPPAVRRPQPLHLKLLPERKKSNSKGNKKSSPLGSRTQGTGLMLLAAMLSSF
jgi:hypothetical protein